MASRALAVSVGAEMVVCESDGRTFLLVTTRCGERVLGIQVLEADEAAA